MTTIVLGPTEVLSHALADSVGAVTVIDATPDANDMMWRAVVALQAAHASAKAQGGRIVVVLPTIGITGAAGLVSYTTAIEGIRAMAKSAARQWDSDAVAVNIVAAPARVFAPMPADSDARLSAAPMQDDTALIHSIAEATKFLLRPDITHVIGETVIVDGGSVMLP